MTGNDVDVPHGRGIVVTGAAQGLGMAIAMRLAADGLAVVVIDTNAERLAELAAALGRGHATIVGDAGDEDVLDRACLRARDMGAGLRGFVANAGVTKPGESRTYALRDWDRLQEVNLRAAFAGARTAARYLTAGGSIVMISSVSAAEGFGGRAAYCASKAGVEGLVRSLATEWGPEGIRVNAVAPGSIRTEMQAAMVASGRVSEDAYLAKVPLHRLGEPAEIAAAVSFLSSADASYVTGAVLPVDGGWQSAGMPSQISR